MKKFKILSMALLLSSVAWLAYAVSWNKTDPLFFIERNKNRNLVQYDVTLMENNDLPDSSPVAVYWVLENGKKQNLTWIERKYAYGIASQEKLEENKFRILLVAFKDREIIVERLDDDFRAVVSINGKLSILEKVYIESRKTWTGFPKVLYVDFFGRNKQNGVPMRERVIPK